ncbi:arsenic transporter [Arthrobacter woluwensis]|uniref:SLC13 family permease n=1 Tax=Arthrobacter woluwensis TaxID=156980 RepID=UPI000D11572B|nr:SLC13 family permease [Arthrobacter woluwensis]PSS44219.1 arsenic transporter [Arthrobacter woluwensis]
MRLLLIGFGLLLLGGIAVLTGVLPAPEALALGERVLPVLLFAGGITVVAELAADAGVFRAVSGLLAGLARGRTVLLWLLIVLLSILCTAFLSIDTTAVLLTPVVVLLASHAGLRPFPFALTTVWLANTASLWLPVSNLSNLLATHRLGDGTAGGFLQLLWAPALVASLLPALLIFLLFRRELRGAFTPEVVKPPEDKVLFWISAAVTAVLLPLLTSGLEPWIPACAAAAVLLVVFAVRRRTSLSWRLFPGPLIVFVCGLFLVVQSVHSLGVTTVLSGLGNQGSGLPQLLAMAGSGAVGSNVVNNLPAYLGLEPFATSPQLLGSLLIGVNTAPLVTPWASLATLLWHDRLKTVGVSVSWGAYIRLGLVAAPLVMITSVLALWLTHG